MAKNRTSAAEQTEFCPERISIRVDDDARALINESKRTVDWPSITQAVNAAIRQAYKNFVPRGATLIVPHLEQLVFARKGIFKRLSDNKRARK